MVRKLTVVALYGLTLSTAAPWKVPPGANASPPRSPSRRHCMLCFCADIDECEFENGGCSQLCENTEGSFRCQCHNGFQIGNDAVSCFSNSVHFFLSFFLFSLSFNLSRKQVLSSASLLAGWFVRSLFDFSQTAIRFS